jgi:hypothetical protein
MIVPRLPQQFVGWSPSLKVHLALVVGDIGTSEKLEGVALFDSRVYQCIKFKQGPGPVTHWQCCGSVGCGPTADRVCGGACSFVAAAAAAGAAAQRPAPGAHEWAGLRALPVTDLTLLHYCSETVILLLLSQSKNTNECNCKHCKPSYRTLQVLPL